MFNTNDPLRQEDTSGVSFLHEDTKMVCDRALTTGEAVVNRCVENDRFPTLPLHDKSRGASSIQIEGNIGSMLLQNVGQFCDSRAFAKVGLATVDHDEDQPFAGLIESDGGTRMTFIVEGLVCDDGAYPILQEERAAREGIVDPPNGFREAGAIVLREIECWIACDPLVCVVVRLTFGGSHALSRDGIARMRIVVPYLVGQREEVLKVLLLGTILQDILIIPRIEKICIDGYLNLKIGEKLGGCACFQGLLCFWGVGRSDKKGDLGGVKWNGDDVSDESWSGSFHFAKVGDTGEYLPLDSGRLRAVATPKQEAKVEQERQTDKHKKAPSTTTKASPPPFPRR